MKRTAYIGIDPGLSGAIVVFDPTEVGDPVIMDMPYVVTQRNGKNKKWIAFDMLAELIHEFAPALTVIESVHAMPGQGVTSAFSFGVGFGSICTMAAAWGAPVIFPEPTVWKRAFGLVGMTKQHSRLQAQKLFPSVVYAFSRSKDDGRAEAALLAYYGYRYGAAYLSSQKGHI